MYVSDSSSREANHRQARQVADEKARTQKVYADGVVREGEVRQSGEAPAREEIDRFRALMQRSGTQQQPAKPQPQGTREAAPADPRSGARGSASTQAPANPQSLVDRFRAMLLLGTMTRDAEQSEAAGAQAEAGSSSESAEQRPTAKAPDTPAQTRMPSNAQAAPTREPTPRPATPISSSTPPPAKAGDGAADKVATTQTRGDAPKQVGDTDSAEVAESTTHKAAEGQGHVAASARRAHGDNESSGGAGGGDSAQSLALPTPGTPQAIQANGSTAMMPPQTMSAQSSPQQASSTGAVAQGLAELMQKHVKQMLVSDVRGSRGGSREVLLRMQNDILPGTDLWLTRTDSGWSLRADVRSRDAYDTLLANQDDLIQRFAEASLGALSIDPVFHGDSDSQRLLASAAGPASQRNRTGERDREQERDRNRDR